MAFVNAYNFMDGVDGISVVQAVTAGIAWLLVGTQVESPVLAFGGAIVAGAALGFAPFTCRGRGCSWETSAATS